jgi:hypothetical protein
VSPTKPLFFPVGNGLKYCFRFLSISTAFLREKVIFPELSSRFRKSESSSWVVFNCEYQQEQSTFVLKISRQNCCKEKFIIEEINKIKPQNIGQKR